MNAAARAALKRAQLQSRVDAISGELAAEPRKRGKFNNVHAIYKGEKYDSIGEAEYAFLLDTKLKAKQIKAWTRGKPVVLLQAVTLRGRITYCPDFCVMLNDGTVRFYDYKGSHVTMTQAWRLKVKMWNATQKDPLWVVFQSGEEYEVAAGLGST